MSIKAARDCFLFLFMVKFTGTKENLMEELTLNAAKREVLGKKSRFLRRQGVTPAHLFGHSLDSLALQCDTAELKKVIARAGETRLIGLKIKGDREPKRVFLREIQRDSLGKTLLHVDFYQVRMEEKMTMDVPIVLVGEAPAMKSKGRFLSHGITELSIECLPAKVPPQIEVDISVLADLDDAVHVKDIVLDPEIEILAEPDQLVVKVNEVSARAEEEAALEAEAGEAAEAKAEEGGETPATEASSEKE
jgi:large subunit ribosomal protein L25